MTRHKDIGVDIDKVIPVFLVTHWRDNQVLLTVHFKVVRTFPDKALVGLTFQEDRLKFPIRQVGRAE